MNHKNEDFSLQTVLRLDFFEIVQWREALTEANFWKTDQHNLPIA